MYTILLAILCMGSYATGAVVTRRSRQFWLSSPLRVPEVFLAAVALAVIFFLRPAHFSIPFLLVCGAAMWLLGAGVSLIARTVRKGAKGGTREFEEFFGARSSVSLWNRWLAFSRAVADYQVRLVLVATYLLPIAPVAIAFRLLRRDPPRDTRTTTWSPRTEASSLDAARRPF